MWSQLTLVSDAEIGQLEPEAVLTGAPWGATTWANARTEGKKDVKILLEADYADTPGVADKILDRWAPDYAFAYTDSAYSDITSAVRDDSEEDVALATIFTTAATDRLYVGASWEFDGLFVKLLDSVNANASVMTVNYWGASGWTTLSATDGTIASVGKTLSGTGRVTWTLPTAWEPRSLNGTSEQYFWVQIVVSATLTAGTVASQILPIRAPDGLKRVAACFALNRILRGLAAGAANPEAWLERAKSYRDEGMELWGLLKERGGIPLDIVGTGAIEPETGETSVRRTVSLGRA